MQVTRKSVLIETTHRVHGMLEQGGVSGRVVAYDRARVAGLLGVSISDLKSMRLDDLAPGYVVTVGQLIEHHLLGRVIRRGHRIL